jgi:sulfur transfer protein SufE
VSQLIKLSDDLNVITAEINSYKQMAGQAIFEIGKRLKHVKENDLAHGEWMNWCESKLGFSSDQANKYIKVYRRFSNSDSNQNLGVNALYLLTSFSDEQIKQKHEVPSTGEQKTVGGMTNRELQEVRQKLKQSEEEKQRLGQMLTEERNKQPEVVEKEIVKEVIPKNIEQKMKDDEFKLKNFRRGYDELKEKIQRLELEQTDDYNHEIAEMKKKKLQQEADISTLQLRVHIKNFLEKVAINSYMQGAISSADPATKKKLQESVDMLDQFTDQINSSLQGRTYGGVING